MSGPSAVEREWAGGVWATVGRKRFFGYCDVLSGHLRIQGPRRGVESHVTSGHQRSSDLEYQSVECVVLRIVVAYLNTFGLCGVHMEPAGLLIYEPKEAPRHRYARGIYAHLSQTLLQLLTPGSVVNGPGDQLFRGLLSHSSSLEALNDQRFQALVNVGNRFCRGGRDPSCSSSSQRGCNQRHRLHVSRSSSRRDLCNNTLDAWNTCV